MRSLRCAYIGVTIGMAALLAPPAHAEYCANEKIVTVITQGTQIFFTTDKSCPNWCSIDTSWPAAAQDRAFSQLLTAQNAGKPITFFWNAGAVACAVQATFASPATLMSVAP